MPLNSFTTVLKSWWALLCALLFLISDIAEYPPRENHYEEVSVQSFALTDALVRAQGVTNDGEYYYFSSNYFLIKTELDGETVVARNMLAIPLELQQLGCGHIGGISYYDGKIYAPIEDSKVFENLYIGVYDSETLELLSYHPLPLELQEKGAPWCVADPDKGYLYTARRDHITEINVFDINTMEYIEQIHLQDSVHKVQGGEMYEGILYLAVSREEQAVFAVNLETGQVQKAFARNLHENSEGEGLTILPTEDGALFHVLDIGRIYVVAHFRHYAFDVNSLVWSSTP